jgi:hypothetical protein
LLLLLAGPPILRTPPALNPFPSFGFYYPTLNVTLISGGPMNYNVVWNG